MEERIVVRYFADIARNNRVLCGGFVHVMLAKRGFDDDDDPDSPLAGRGASVLHPVHRRRRRHGLTKRALPQLQAGLSARMRPLRSDRNGLGWQDSSAHFAVYSTHGVRARTRDFVASQFSIQGMEFYFHLIAAHQFSDLQYEVCREHSVLCLALYVRGIERVAESCMRRLSDVVLLCS